MDDKNRIAEKREHARVETPGVTAAYRLLDLAKVANAQAKTSVQVNNISLGGASLTLDQPLPKEAPISMDIRMNEFVEMIKSFGKVVWTRKNRPNVYEVGVVFSWWTKEEDKRNLADYIERNLL